MTTAVPAALATDSGSRPLGAAQRPGGPGLHAARRTVPCTSRKRGFLGGSARRGDELNRVAAQRLIDARARSGSLR
jgi:hypothetical protein